MSRARLSARRPELPQHRRLLRDEVGIERVSEPVGGLRTRATADRGVLADGDDEMAAAGQRPQHAPDVFDFLLERGGDRRGRELETDGRGRFERLALRRVEVIDVPRDHFARAFPATRGR